MKFAAKRTWPERSAAWELQGDAETPHAFGLGFAVVRQLGQDTEFLVMEGEGDVHFFRVASCDPYTLAAAEPRAASSAVAPKTLTASPAVAAPVAPVAGTAAPARGETGTTPGTDDAQSAPPEVFVPSMKPFVGTILYMAKVGIIAIGVIAGLAFVLNYFRN